MNEIKKTIKDNLYTVILFSAAIVIFIICGEWIGVIWSICLFVSLFICRPKNIAPILLPISFGLMVFYFFLFISKIYYFAYIPVGSILYYVNYMWFSALGVYLTIAAIQGFKNKQTVKIVLIAGAALYVMSNVYNLFYNWSYYSYTPINLIQGILGLFPMALALLGFLLYIDKNSFERILFQSKVEQMVAEPTQQLNDLKKLYHEGTITEEEYKQKRQQIIDKL